MNRTCLQRAGLFAFVSLVTLLSGCHKAESINGTYQVLFTIEGNDLSQVNVRSLDNAQSVPIRIQNTVAEEVAPIVREQTRKANLRQASGEVSLSIHGMPPYLVQLKEFRITRPDFLSLSAAVQSQDVEAIGRIVSENHNVNQRELPSQQTALGVAAAGAYLRSLGSLLKLGADPNIPNNTGTTPLMAAVTNGSDPTVRALIQAGANPDLADSVGNTALSLAKELDRKNLISLIESAQSSSRPRR